MLITTKEQLGDKLRGVLILGEALAGLVEIQAWEAVGKVHKQLLFEIIQFTAFINSLEESQQEQYFSVTNIDVMDSYAQAISKLDAAMELVQDDIAVLQDGADDLSEEKQENTDDKNIEVRPVQPIEA